jgi:hypothetical protein
MAHPAYTLPAGVDDVNEKEFNQLILGRMRWVLDDDFDSVAIATIDASFDAVDARSTVIEATVAANLQTLTDAVATEAATRADAITDTNDALVANATALANSIASEAATRTAADDAGAAALAAAEQNTAALLADAETKRVAELKANADADGVESARATAAEQVVQTGLDAEINATNADFAARDVVAADLRADLTAETDERIASLNSTKTKLEANIKENRAEAVAERDALEQALTNARNAAVDTLNALVDETDVRLSAVDAAALVHRKTLNASVIAADGVLAESIASERALSDAADAHASATVANLTVAVAENHAAAAESLSVAVTALDIYHTERVDNATAEHRASFADHLAYLQQLHNRSIATNEDVAALANATDLADAGLRNDTDVLRGQMLQANAGLTAEIGRVEAELFTTKLAAASERTELTAALATLQSEHDALKNNTATEVVRLEAALAATKAELAGTINRTQAQVRENEEVAASSMSAMQSGVDEDQGQLPTFLAVTAIISTIVSAIVSIMINKCTFNLFGTVGLCCVLPTGGGWLVEMVPLGHSVRVIPTCGSTHLPYTRPHLPLAPLALC